MKFRKLEQKDKEQMLILMEEFWMKNQRDELLSGELKEIAELKNPAAQMKIELEEYFLWHTYILEDEENIVGFVVGKISNENDRVLDKIGNVEELFVTEKARGQKLGQQLMEKILTVFKDEGCKVIRTSAYANNTAALSLYRKFGFIDESIELSRKA